MLNLKLNVKQADGRGRSASTIFARGAVSRCEYVREAMTVGFKPTTIKKQVDMAMDTTCQTFPGLPRAARPSGRFALSNLVCLV